MMDTATAEYRDEELGLSCTSNFNNLKLTGKRLIDGTIINSVYIKQVSGPREEV